MRKLILICFISLISSCKTTSQTKKTEIDTIVSLKENSKIELIKPDSKFIIQLIQDEDNFLIIYLPILTLLLGIFIEKGWEAFKESKKFHKNIKRWKLELNALLNPITNQIQHLKDFNINQLENKNLMPNLGLETALDCENFTLLDRTELFDYLRKIQKFNETESLHNVNKINSNIKAIRFYYDKIIEKFNDYKSGRSKYTSALNLNLQQLLLEYNKLKVKNAALIRADLNIQRSFVNVQNLINSEITPFLEDGDFKIFEMKDKFFQPIINEMNRISTQVDVLLILEYVDNCLNQLKGIEREIGYVTKNFENFEEQLEVSEKSLNDSMKILV